jgi:hypothetical protein
MWFEEESCRAKEQRPRSLMPRGALSMAICVQAGTYICPNPGHVKRENFGKPQNVNAKNVAGRRKLARAKELRPKSHVPCGTFSMAINVLMGLVEFVQTELM